MSSRIYPLYQKGNPQLRVFLPNFWMKLVKPREEQPPNVATFSCSMEMTNHDVKNYLEKIYNVPVVQVRTRTELGPTRRDPGSGYVVKDDDIKYAYVVMPKTEKFEFPDLFPQSVADKQREEENQSLDEAKKGYERFLQKNKERTNLPGWFSI